MILFMLGVGTWEDDKVFPRLGNNQELNVSVRTYGQKIRIDILQISIQIANKHLKKCSTFNH